MQQFNSISIQRLTLIGFTLVILPLVIALLVALSEVKQLSTQSVDSVFNVASLAQSSRKVSTLVINTERYARQYAALGDKEFLQLFNEQRQDLLDLVEQMSMQHSDQQLSQKLVLVSMSVNSVNSMLNQETNTEDAIDLDPQFSQLKKLISQIDSRKNELIAQAVVDIENNEEDVRWVITGSAIIIPIVIALAIFFSRLITQPLRRLKRQISRLEQGDLDHPVNIKGSEEVQAIAETIETMRLRLRALEMQKTQFIRHISHELKTPLAAIREGTELLFDDSLGGLNNAQKEVTDILRSSVSRLQNLIEDLLNFNMVLDAINATNQEATRVDQVVESVLTTHKLQIKQKEISIIRRLTNVTVDMNREHLRVIVDNLISNAIKYSPTGEPIVVSVTSQDNRVKITVKDQGPGIPSHQQPYIFDPFFQGRPPIDSKIKSSGLGLTISKELCNRYTGNISLLDSTGGSLFCIDLPIHQKGQ